jgi:hypothetical protein
MSRTKQGILIFIGIVMRSECCIIHIIQINHQALVLLDGNLIGITVNHRNADLRKITVAVVTRH